MPGKTNVAKVKLVALRYFKRNDFKSALILFEKCLEEAPNDRDILHYKARCFEGLGRLEESLRCIDDSLALEPSDASGILNRALMLIHLSRREEAIADLDRVIALEPTHVEAAVKRAQVLHQVGRREEALASAHGAVTIAPDDLNARNMRCMILDDLGRREEALADCEAILKADPNYSAAITNRAILHAQAGEFHEALGCYDRSLTIDPTQLHALYNRSVVRLVLGDWTQGFKEFEIRWKIFPHEAKRLTGLAPAWLGQADLKGKTILLHHEQGFGDALQFCRYVPLVKARGARVILAVPAALRRLMGTLPGSAEVIAEGAPVPAHDFHCPLMSLPLAFGTTPATVPAAIPYLRADPHVARAWADRLSVRHRLRIGLVWSGRRYPPINDARDMAFDLMRRLLAVDADFVCLHTELSEEERLRIGETPNLTWLGDQLKDFADTAGLIANLDLVITVDTAVAHLAGALGKPVWLMNRYATCWRWLLNRADSPWYPSMRIFRQPALKDWSSVIEDVREAAEKLVAQFFVRARKASAKPLAETIPPIAVTNWHEVLQRALDHYHRGEFAQAIAGYHIVLSAVPDHAQTLHFLGVALAQTGRCSEALAPLTRAIQVNPSDAAAHAHLGNALAGLSRHEDAIASYARAIACDNTLADSHYNCGLAQSALGRAEAALGCYTKAVDLNPSHALAQNARGNALSEVGRSAEALDCYARAIAVRPDFVDAWINQAHLLRRLHDYEAALQSSERALLCDPGHAKAHNCRGAALAGLGRYADAHASYARALELDPSLPEASWNLSLLKLSEGDFHEGWPLYESRWNVKALKLIRRFSDKPAWRGSQAIEGKHILLHAEQGYGDTIQFSRYCSVLGAQGARVSVGVPASLKSLFQTLPGVHEVLGQETERAFDHHCSLMSLPLALGTQLQSIPAPTRYLHGAAPAVARWGERLGASSDVPRVGLAWSGRPTHSNDFNRSIPFEVLRPLTRCAVQWVSLQKEIRRTDEAHLAELPDMLRFGEELTDFAETAALMESLDLIITVDTAVAHLAGALGKPVWILLPYVSDWRWLRDREDSPWYPSARLFRQSTRGDWESAVERVAESLETQFESPSLLAPTPTRSSGRGGKSNATTRIQLTG